MKCLFSPWARFNGKYLFSVIVMLLFKTCNTLFCITFHVSFFKIFSEFILKEIPAN